MTNISIEKYDISINPVTRYFEYIKSIWDEKGSISEIDGKYVFRTGGSSWNENIMAGMIQNTLFWLQYFDTAEPGGIYYFLIPKGEL